LKGRCPDLKIDEESSIALDEIDEIENQELEEK
jgi:hypothetical protein